MSHVECLNWRDHCPFFRHSLVAMSAEILRFVRSFMQLQIQEPRGSFSKYIKHILKLKNGKHFDTFK